MIAAERGGDRISGLARDRGGDHARILSVFVLSGVNDRVVGFAFAFSAGASTYVGASDLIPEINHSRNRVIPLLVFGGCSFLDGKRAPGPLAGH